MRILKKNIVGLDRVTYYQTHLLVISPFLPVEITPKEREVLGLFMSFEGDLAKVDRLGTSFRREVKTRIKPPMSSGGLTNHITALKEKGLIYETLNGTLAIREYLFPDENQQGYQFILTMKKDETSSNL